MKRAPRSLFLAPTYFRC